MNAVFRASSPLPCIEPMAESDLDAVLEIENRIYEFPWTRGNFRDSVRAGYSCWVLRGEQGVIGYAVLMLALEEAHLLNLSIDSALQHRGYGTRFLEHLMQVARDYGSEVLLLEVRPSNRIARSLYATHGFREISCRPGYYPAKGGREDALLLARDL